VQWHLSNDNTFNMVKLTSSPDELFHSSGWPPCGDCSRSTPNNKEKLSIEVYINLNNTTSFKGQFCVLNTPTNWLMFLWTSLEELSNYFSKTCTKRTYAKFNNSSRLGFHNRFVPLDNTLISINVFKLMLTRLPLYIN